MENNTNKVLVLSLVLLMSCSSVVQAFTVGQNVRRAKSAAYKLAVSPVKRFASYVLPGRGNAELAENFAELPDAALINELIVDQGKKNSEAIYDIGAFFDKEEASSVRKAWWQTKRNQAKNIAYLVAAKPFVGAVNFVSPFFNRVSVYGGRAATTLTSPFARFWRYLLPKKTFATIATQIDDNGIETALARNAARETAAQDSFVRFNRMFNEESAASQAEENQDTWGNAFSRAFGLWS